MAAPLTQQHQIFLQAMMANRVMRYDDARRMHHEIVTSAVEPGADRKSISASKWPAFRLGDDASAFDRFWSDIARALRFLDLDMRRVKWPEDEQLYLGVVNKQGGETAKLATRLSPEQIALFRAVLDEILRDDRAAERGVDVMAALNATQTLGGVTQTQTTGETQTALTQDQRVSLGKMSKVEKEQTLRVLCADGWLTQGDDEAGRLRLGVRAFLELRDFLLSNAPERAKEKWLNMI